MKRRLRVIVPILILMLLIAWRIGQKNAETAGQSGQRAMKMKMPAIVTLAPAQIRDITQTFEATGSVEAPLSVKIAPKITGRIGYLKVREGDRIRKGEVLVRIDATEVEANVQQQLASLAEAQYRLAQAQMSQNPTDVAINTQIRQQNAGVISANADFNQAQKSADAAVVAASASLSDAQYKAENAKAAVRSAQANLDNAKAKYNRINNLFTKGFVAAQDVDDAKAALSVQESAVEIAQGQLRSSEALSSSAKQQLDAIKAKSAADVAASNAKAIQAHASLEYAQANTSQISAFRQSIEALKASVAAARASVNSAKARRQDAVLVSPLDGFVTGRYADPGAIASSTQPILAVQFMKQIWVTVAVPEDVCAKLHIGQPANIQLGVYPGKTFLANVIQINPSADPQSRQFTVRVILSNEEGLFKPGMFARVSLETDRVKNVLTVPREAILRDKDGSYVMTVDPAKKAKRVAVTPGAENEEFVAIDGELRSGQKVVTMSAMPVKEGQTVIPGGGKLPGGHGRGGKR